MAILTERVECKELLEKLMPVEEAVKFVSNHSKIAISGFTKSGEPKVFIPALARYLQQYAPETKIGLFSGASLSEDVENPIASFVGKRGPYMSSSASRKLINAGEMDFADIHLSTFARNFIYGFYGDIDLAVVEVSRIRPDGSVILSSSVGVSAEALAKANKIILEVNTAIPDYTGFHDIAIPTVHPRVNWPIPIINVADRVGSPYVEIDTRKVVAIVESNKLDYPVSFKPTSETDRRIAENVIDFLMYCHKTFNWGKRLPPIQSGVGNVANAIVGELYRSPFQKIRFWTEVFQDGMMRYVEDDDKFESASATALSFSETGRNEFLRLFKRCREKVVLRPMWLSNNAEIITRLFVIAMNTPIEVDIYGHVNSTHVDGSRVVNGLGRKMVVLIVSQDTNELHQLNKCLQKNGHQAVTTDSIRSALRIVKKEPLGLVLLNLNGQMTQALGFMETIHSLTPEPPVVAISPKARLEDAVELMKAGAHDYWVKPISEERLSKTIEWLQYKAEAESGKPPEYSTDSFIITQNERMAQLKFMAKKVARKAPVFLQGESGTGKELFARYIHQSSDRSGKPFVAINCAALPESLIESELFGHEKGAFTGAIKAREGKFELAHTGTLFLDEVTEIPLHLQSKLLRVLQEGEVDRVGGKHPFPVDVRVIASTNVALEEALKSGTFRRDLYYRLNVIPLKILPLRERRDDIPMLCRHFVEKYNRLHQCDVEQVTPQALKLLHEHSWPGNVRELENVIQRAMLLTMDNTIAPEHILLDDHAEPDYQGPSLELMSIEEMEKRMIHKALESFDGNRTRAAEILGISVRTLRNKLHEYGASDRSQLEGI